MTTYYSIADRFKGVLNIPFRLGYANISTESMSKTYASYACQCLATTFEISSGFISATPDKDKVHATMSLEAYINYIRCVIFRS